MSDNDNKPQSDWQEREIGALWKNEGRNQKYLSGHIKNEDGSSQKVVIFSNKNRNNEKAPHFRVYKSKDRDAAPQAAQQSYASEAAQEESDELI